MARVVLKALASKHTPSSKRFTVAVCVSYHLAEEMSEPLMPDPEDLRNTLYSSIAPFLMIGHVEA